MTEPLIVPAARVVFKPLLFAFGVLAGYFVAWGAVFCADALTRWVFGNLTSSIGWIPFVGKVINKPILALSSKLTRYLGELEAKFDRQMGIRWHALASIVSQLAADTKAAAIFNYHIAGKVLTFWGNSATGGLMKQTHDAAKHAGAQAAGATQAAIDARARAQAPAASSAGATVIPHPRIGAPSRVYPRGRVGSKVAGLEGELGHVIDVTIPDIAGRVRGVEDSLGRLWHRVRGDAAKLAAGAAIGALVYALGRLGMGSLRCKNVGRAAKQLCGMQPGLFEALLADTALILSAISIVTLAEEVLAIEDEVIGFVKRGFVELRDVQVPSAAEALASGEW